MTLKEHVKAWQDLEIELRHRADEAELAHEMSGFDKFEHIATGYMGSLRLVQKMMDELNVFTQDEKDWLAGRKKWTP